MTDAPERIARIIRENLSGVTSADPDIRAAQEDDLMRTAKLIAADLCASGQQVRALEWEQVDPTAVLGHGIEPCQYYIRYEVGSWWMPGDAEVEDAQEFDDLEAAKAAAQADYERRILAALTPAPQPEVAPMDNPALVEALREVSQALAWQCFGECRGFSENLKSPSEALSLARTALASHEAPPATQEPVDVRKCQTCQGFGWIKNALNKCPNCAIPPACQQEAVPVAWRCKDYADDWIVYGNKAQAELYQACTGCLMEALYVHPPQPSETVAEALLQRAVDLIKGDLTGSEWKRACNAFVKDALRALKGSDQ